MFYIFYNAKSILISVNANLCWLNNVSGVYIVQVSLLLIGQQSLGDFFRYQQFNANAGGKRPIQCQPLLAQYKQQANLILSMNNNTPLLISWNAKNKQLTLLSQCKLALTVRNTLFAL
jgi:hypothetical protein